MSISNILKSYWLYILFALVVGIQQYRYVSVTNELDNLKTTLKIAEFKAVSDSVNILYSSNKLINNLESKYATSIKEITEGNYINDYTNGLIRVQLKATKNNNPKSNSLPKTQPNCDAVSEPITRDMGKDILYLRNSIQRDQETIKYLQNYIVYLEKIINDHNIR